MAIRTVIVEDSSLYLHLLSEIIKTIPEVEVVGKASDFESARKVIEEQDPDLLCLDVEIGQVTSFELIPFVPNSTKIIFITSHTDYAIKAFEVAAVDYLVKPVTRERLIGAIQRVFRTQENVEPEVNSEENPEDKLQYQQKIMIQTDERFIMVNLSDIIYLEALGNYVRMHMGDGKRHTHYGSIKSWMNRLPKEHFIQIHRSLIINLNHIDRIEKWTNDTGRAYMKGLSEPLEISRSYFAQMKKDFKA